VTSLSDPGNAAHSLLYPYFYLFFNPIKQCQKSKKAIKLQFNNAD